MILRGAQANSYCARPDPARAALLLCGADPMRVAMKRQEAIAALIGPQGEVEMRLTRIAAADLRKQPSLVSDGLRETGFFPGPRVVMVEDATDGLAALLEQAIKDWRPGDANLVVTAGNLTGKSTLKGLFDKRPDCASITFYDEPPTAEEIKAELAKAGISAVSPDALEEIQALARALDPGDFRQTLEKIALYKFEDASPLTPSEVSALAPVTVEGGQDELLNACAEGRIPLLGPLVQRLEGQGTSPVTLCIGAMRHFRTLHAAAAAPGGVDAYFQWVKMAPKQKAALQRQAANWGLKNLEGALSLLVETDLTLRSASRAPAMAVMERALIKLAYMSRPGRG